VLDRELERFFARRWVLVGRAAGLQSSGAYLTADVAGESVIVVRQDDDTVEAMVNMCRHRGARILLNQRAASGTVLQALIARHAVAHQREKADRIQALQTRLASDAGQVRWRG
jgi:thioredoxin-like negative regulator of GroEL